MNTFKVNDVKIIESGIKGKVTMREALIKQVGKIDNKTVSSLVEDVSEREKVVLPSNYNSFVASCSIAFEQHKRLILSPDIIWLSILQQLAIHINENAESLRNKFVEFEGKKSLVVYNDTFVKGQPNNWENIFPDYTSQIKSFIGDENYNTIMGEFSTTNAISKVAFEIAMMDCMKSYFDYGFCTCCGIPEITLEGETADWEKILKKAKDVGDYDLSWWTNELIPILEQFVEASKDNVDKKFWESFFKLDGGSGGPYINGHIIKIFPYSKDYKNTYAKRDLKRAMTTSEFASGLSNVPFLWSYFSKVFPMSFISGFIGIEATNESLKPNIGWGILNRNVDEKEFKEETERFVNNLEKQGQSEVANLFRI